MTGPKPKPKAPVRPVVLPDLQVFARPQNAIELAFRQMGMAPAVREQSQAAFRDRMAAFRHDLPRALPGGAVKMAGSALTDVASLDLPFLPPAFPSVRAKGDEATQALTERLHELLGAPVGSEGTGIGEDLGGLLASVLGPEAMAKIFGPAERAAYGLPKIGHQAGEWSWASPPVQGPTRAVREFPRVQGPERPVMHPNPTDLEWPTYLRNQPPPDPNALLPYTTRLMREYPPAARVQPWNVTYPGRDAVPFVLGGR